METNPNTGRRPGSRPGAAALAGLAAVLSLVGCGGSSGSPSSTRAAAAQPPSATATSTVTHTATVAPQASTSTTTTATAGPRQCVASDLALVFLGQNGGMGHGELGFAVRNVSSAGCRTGGYPGVEFLSASGAALPTKASRTTLDFFGHAPVVALSLAPGQTASFRLAVTHIATAGQSCVTARALQVIAPNDTATMRAALPDGAYECGTATVSPLRPGSSAYG